MLIKIFVFGFVCCATPVVGQTLTEIDKEYGKPIYSYSVSEHIWMTPDYGSDGQVCRMRLYPKHIDSETEYLSPHLKFEELAGVLNDLVPLGRRGAKKDSFGISDFGGGVAWITYAYEKVTFVLSFSARLDPSIKKQPKAESFSVNEVTARIPKKTPPSLDDFAPSKSTQIEIATILWNDRKCGP